MRCDSTSRKWSVVLQGVFSFVQVAHSLAEPPGAGMAAASNIATGVMPAICIYLRNSRAESTRLDSSMPCVCVVTTLCTAMY